MVNDITAKKIITKNFLKYLDRNPDEQGLTYFTHLLITEQITEFDLINRIKNSSEYIGRINLVNYDNPWEYSKFGSTKQKIREFTSFLRGLPNFLVLGTIRGGTTSLYEHLTKHPQIPEIQYKELHYFSKHYQRGINWYKSFFPLMPSLRTRKMKMCEITPTYLHHPHAPERIRHHLPNVKLIVLFRNPIERAYSHYRYRFQYSTEKLSFEECFKQEEKTLLQSFNDVSSQKQYYDEDFYSNNYFSLGIYWSQIERWLKFFPKHQFLFLSSEDLFSNPQIVLKSIFDFLEIEPISSKIFDKVHSSHGPVIDSSFRKQLSKFYEPHNQKLFEIINQTYSW